MVDNGGGRIVIISSIGAITAMPKSSIYSSIKSGIHSYGRSIASELKSKNISVTISMPGYVKTNAHKKIVLGKNGNMIKTIGTNSRLKLEKIMKKKVNLFVKIKVSQKNK